MPRRRELRALLALARAHLAGRSARVRFRDTERSTATRIVDVLALAFDPPRWVAATWAREAASLRLLDLARVLAVFPTRRRAGPPPAGFDPAFFALRALLDPAPGPPISTSVRVGPPWPPVARALLPTCDVEPLAAGEALLHVRASRPAVVVALAASLAGVAGVDSASSPWPRPSRRPTRRASSASLPGSSRSPSRSPARASTRGSPSTGGSRRPRRRCSPATRTR